MENHYGKRLLLAAWLSLTAVGLSGCMAASVSHRDCCYEGHAPVAYLNDLRFEMENGERKSYTEVLPGLTSDRSVFTFPVAFDEADDTELAAYPSLEQVLPSYHANGNQWIEKPELVVLYLREIARGLGQPVKAIELEETVGALVLPQTEVGGLTRYLRDVPTRMTPDVQAMFNDLELLGMDLRSLPAGGLASTSHPNRCESGRCCRVSEGCLRDLPFRLAPARVSLPDVPRAAALPG